MASTAANRKAVIAAIQTLGFTIDVDGRTAYSWEEFKAKGLNVRDIMALDPPAGHLVSGPGTHAVYAPSGWSWDPVPAAEVWECLWQDLSEGIEKCPADSPDCADFGCTKDNP